MKQLTFLSKLFILLLAITFWTSCEEDTPGGGGGGITLPPVITLESGADLITTATSLSPGGTFKVRVKADQGDNPMQSFTVLEDGIAIDASRLNYNSAGTGALSNPYTLTTTEQTAFDTNIEITGHTEGDTRTYTFRITDSAGETDDVTVEVTVVVSPLSIAFDGSNGGLTADVTLPSVTTFKVQLQATKGGSPLSTLSVLEDGTAVDAGRARFFSTDDLANATTFPSNPLTLIDDEKNGINWFVWVNSHDAGTRTYTFRITDENGDSEEVSLNITVESLVELTGKLMLNAGGPVGTGGINLLTGDGTGSSATDGAHIRDLGIDTNQPASSNWIQKIAPTDGSVLKTPGADSPVDDFNAVVSKAEIQSAFNGGTTITESAVVNIGDKFLVQVPTGEIVLVLVTNVEVKPMMGDNDDFYELSIKY